MKKSMHNVSGMTFLEIMIVLVLIGLMGAAIAPNLAYYVKKQKHQEFVLKLESFMYQVKQQALLTGKVQQVFFEFKEKKIIALTYDETFSDQPLSNRFSRSKIKQIELDQSFELQNFFIQGNDEVRSGSTRDTAWFYIMPDGSSQDVVINFTYGEEQEQKLGIKINPFSAQVFSYDTFQFP